MRRGGRRGLRRLLGLGGTGRRAGRRSGSGRAGGFNPPGGHPHCDVGVCFDESVFLDGDGDGAADGYGIAGQKDFPAGGYNLFVQDGAQMVTISSGASTKGDAGITRTFAASEGQTFAAAATACVRDKTGGFKARLTISARTAQGPQLEEWNDRITDETEPQTIRVTGAVMPPGTELVTVKFRAHTMAPGEEGRAELRRFTFERLS